MRHLFSRRPSAAMVVAIAALIVAMSGTAVAASTLVKGDSLIKKNSLSGNRLKNHSVTGNKIKVKTLGTVPSALHASTADSATNASNAANAANAANANTVGGDSPAAFEAASNWTRSGLVGADRGQSVTLASFGPFTLTLKCVDGGASGPEAQILVTSSQAGSTAFGTALPFAGSFFDNGPDTVFNEFSGTGTFVSPSAEYSGLIMDAINSPASSHACIASALVSKD